MDQTGLVTHGLTCLAIISSLPVQSVDIFLLNLVFDISLPIRFNSAALIRLRQGKLPKRDRGGMSCLCSAMPR